MHTTTFSQKSNFPPGHVNIGDKFDNGSFRMDSKKSSSYGYVCFEPAEEYRGDFARTYFYMATAYEDLNWQEAYRDYVNPDSYLFFSNDIISVLLDWHRADPVSDKEICRADQISSIQHNRNPYIDYPELVEYIWGDKKGEAVDFSELVCTTGTASCIIPDEGQDTETRFDTIVALPILTKACISETAGGYASDKIQSNGTAAITMGTSTTDGAIGFKGLNIRENTFIRFRASVYNTAEKMQIDISADGQLIESVRDTARQETRNEENTQTVELLSVGGSTGIRACMQELYILQEKPQKTVLTEAVYRTAAHKYIKDGILLIQYDGSEYNIFGARMQ